MNEVLQALYDEFVNEYKFIATMGNRSSIRFEVRDAAVPPTMRAFVILQIVGCNAIVFGYDKRVAAGGESVKFDMNDESFFTQVLGELYSRGASFD